MKKLQNIVLVLVMLCLTFCKKKELEDDYVFENERFENMDKLSMKEVIVAEEEIGGILRYENSTFGLDEGYYPNKKGFNISYPKVFERNQKELGLETDYFCTANDGLIKVIFYEWRKKFKDLKGFERDTLENISTSETIKYKKKFNVLKEKLTDKLGKATKINIEKHIDTISNYINNYEWKRNDLNVSLSLYYGDDTFNQIRLVIHKN